MSRVNDGFYVFGGEFSASELSDELYRVTLSDDGAVSVAKPEVRPPLLVAPPRPPTPGSRSRRTPLGLPSMTQRMRRLPARPLFRGMPLRRRARGMARPRC